jgi:hypothetical protein
MGKYSTCVAVVLIRRLLGFWSGSQKGFTRRWTEIAEGYEWADGSSIPDGINFIMVHQQFLCLYFSGTHMTHADNCFTGRHKVLKS